MGQRNHNLLIRRVPWIATIAFMSSLRQVWASTNSILCTTRAVPSRTWTAASTRTISSFNTTRIWLRSGMRPKGCDANGTTITKRESPNLPFEFPILKWWSLISEVKLRIFKHCKNSWCTLDYTVHVFALQGTTLIAGWRSSRARDPGLVQWLASFLWAPL